MNAPVDVASMLQDVIAHFSAGRFDAAGHIMPSLLAVVTDQPALHNLAGAIAAGVGDHAGAIPHYDKALLIQPDFRDALSNRGLAHRALGRNIEALADFDAAIRTAPDFAEAHCNRAVILRERGDHAGAVEASRRAIAARPDFAAAHYNLGNALSELQRLDEACESFTRAIALQPEHADAWCNLGNCLHLSGRLEEALGCLDRASTLAPVNPVIQANRGNVAHELKQLDKARTSYEAALRLAPDDHSTAARLAFVKAHACDWSEPDQGRLATLGIEGVAVTPFTLLALDDDPQRGLDRSRNWARHSYPARSAATFASPPGDRIRIGYFSSDFHNHATMLLMAGMLEAHDRHRFEVHAFCYGPHRDDPMRRRVVAAVEHFHDVSASTDAEAAAFARRLGIDVAVDLKGYTQEARPGIMAHGAAPVQMAYLGYPGSMGCDFIDYIIADAMVIPYGSERYYSEKVIRLPHSYQPNDRSRPIGGATPSRASQGLPDQGAVFCCFNNSFKICSDAFASWMGILREVQGSVLWLLSDNEMATRNLRREAQRLGVDPERLIFADRQPLEIHLARHALADLFLDTFAYNAHTTAADALWAGTPVITKRGKAFAARVGASLLRATGLDELVTDDENAYRDLAIALSRDPARLAELKARLVQARDQGPLFDSASFAHNIEKAFGAAMGRHRSGSAPDHIDIAC